MIDFENRVAVVTGGSRGIGRACCRMLARAGARVAFGYQRNSDAARSLVQTIQSGGGQALAVEGDVSTREAFERLFAAASDKFGTVHVVVANAGIWKRAPIEEMSESQWQEMIDVNLKSIYLSCQFAAREMDSGSVVLVSSTAGQRGEAFHSHYAATKGAVISMTKSLAAELGPRGIRVNAVAPGWVDTDMCTEVFADPAYLESVRSTIPLGRVATPEDIAGAIVFLASDLARHVNGEILNVNGGSVLCG